MLGCKLMDTIGTHPANSGGIDYSAAALVICLSEESSAKLRREGGGIRTTEPACRREVEPGGLGQAGRHLIVEAKGAASRYEAQRNQPPREPPCGRCPRRGSRHAHAPTSSGSKRTRQFANHPALTVRPALTRCLTPGVAPLSDTRSSNLKSQYGPPHRA